MANLIESGEGRHRVYLEAVSAGNDIVIYIGGGEKPHVGAISICTGRGRPFTISLPNHKDYLVSHRASQTIFNETGRSTVVIAGIHVDDASEDDIRKLLKNSEECVRSFLSSLKNPP
ncbi:MAG: hypothetical protein H5T34_07425 [Candidatus Methanomethyliales bacterium]|nr:hypothetical protein [Candidatus Methanomethylicales archaeon]